MKRFILSVFFCAGLFVAVAQDNDIQFIGNEEQLAVNDGIISDASFLTEKTHVMASEDEDKTAKVDFFIMQYRNYFPMNRIPEIRSKLMSLDKSHLEMVLYCDEFKNPKTVLLASFFCVDRFMLDDAGLGILKIVTFGGAWVWWVVDICTAQDRARKYNYKRFLEVVNFY